MATVGSLVVKIGADISGLEKGLSSAQDRLNAAGRNLRAVGTGLTLGLSAPLGGIAMQAIRAAGGVEQSMDMIQAATKATESQMASAEKQAWDLGQSSVFSAGEVAGAQLELAKANMDVATILATMPGVVNLAAAADMELSEAASVTANTLNMFNLEASQSTAVADQFAAAANASTADVSDFTAAVNMGGAVLGSYGVKLDDTLTMMALLANRGMKGSDAGTSLKTMFMRLAAPTGEAADMLEKYNVAVYDGQGAMRSSLDILTDLERATADMTDSRRADFLTTVFGADALRAVNMLMAEGTGNYRAMNEVINEQGAAAAMAEARMGGLFGAWEEFGGAAESFLGSQASPFTGMLAGLVRSAAELVTAFGQLPAPVLRFAAVLAAVLAVAGPALIILGSMASGLALLMTPLGLAAAGMVVAAALIVANWDKIKAKTEEVITALEPYWTKLLGWIDAARTGDFGPLLGGLADIGRAVKDWAVEQLTGAKVKLVDLLDTSGLGTVLDLTEHVTLDLASKIREQLASLNVRVEGATGVDVGAKLREAQGRITSGMADIQGAISEAFEAGGWSGLADLAREKVGAVSDALTVKLSEMSTLGQIGLAAGMATVRTQFDEALATAGDFVDSGKIGEWVQRNVEAAKGKFDEWFGEDNLASRTVEQVQGIVGGVIASARAMGDMAPVERFGAAVQAIVDVFAGIGAIKLDVLQTATTFLADTLLQLSTFASGAVSQLDPAQVSGVITGVLDGMVAQIETLADAENLGKIGTAVGKLGAAAVTKLTEMFADPQFGADVGAAIGKATGALVEGASALVEGIVKQLAAVDVGAFQSSVDTFVTNLVQGIGTGLAQADWSAVGTAIKDAIVLAIKSHFGQQTVLETVLSGPLGKAAGWAEDKLGMPTLGETWGAGRNLFGGVEQSATAAATALAPVAPAAESLAQAQTNAAAEIEQAAGQYALDQLNPAMDALMANPDALGQAQVDAAALQQTAAAANTAMASAQTGAETLAAATENAAAEIEQAVAPVSSMGILLNPPVAQSGPAEMDTSALAGVLSGFAWPALPEFAWPALPEWKWPALPEWKWPAIARPSWISQLRVERPDWIAELWSAASAIRAAVSGAGGGGGGIPDGTPLNALGSRWFGGGLTVVGEGGPELVRLPSGASIFSAAETRDLLGGGGGDIHIHLDGVQVRTDLDLEALAWRLAQKIRQHRG